MKKLIAMGLVTAFAVASQAAVVEYWDFEDGVNGQSFTPTGNPNGSGGSVGVNGTLMRGWDSIGGTSWTNDTSPNGGSLGMYSAYQDGYINNDGNVLANGWTSSDFTIEMHVRIDDNNGWETLLSRQGASFGGNEGDLYFQRKGIDAGEFRFNYLPSGATGTGDRIIVDGATPLQAATWYGLAVVADSTAGTVSLYLDDGTGYALDGQVSGLTQDLGILSSTFDWAFFRDYWGGGSDNTIGVMDNVRISDTALTTGELIPVIPEPATIGMVGLFGAGMLFIRRRLMM